MAGTPLGFVDDGAVGYSTTMYGQLVDMVLEYVPDLTWPLSVRTYARMRWDPVLQSTLKAYTMPIRRAAWSIDPAGCRGEVVAFVADQLGLPILGAAAAPSAARRRGVNWGEHLRLSLLDLTFGYMPFERTYGDVVDGRQPLGILQERMPQTIAQINVNRDGSLAQITQNLFIPTGDPSPEIPAQNLVWYAHDKEGTAWMGQSLLRPAYGSWLLKDEVRRVLATSHRRFGMGVPTVTAPPGGTATQVAQAAALAQSIRAGDQSGAGLPDGFRLELAGITGNVPDGLGLVHYLDQQMSRSTLTGLLDLGDTSNGSRALGDSFLDLFILSLQSVADTHAEQATMQIVVPLVDVNWGEDEPAPRIVCGDVGSQHEVTATSLADLVKSGALQPDPALDAFIRGEWKLPARATDWQEPAPPVDPSVAKPAKPAAARAIRAAGGDGQPFRRQPTAVEAAAKTDFGALQGDWQSALDKLVNDWDAISKAQRQSLVDQVKAAVDDEDPAALAGLTVDSKAGAALLSKRMHALADDAAQQQADEGDAQGVAVPVGKPDKDRLSGTAAAIAGLAAAALAGSAGSAALQAWSPNASGDMVAAAVDTHLSGLAGADLTYLLGGALSSAQSEGRSATLAAAEDAGLSASYYASEILDGSTCDECESEDGTEFSSLDDANAAYSSGGFTDCEGGLRCRGVIVTVWDGAASSQAA